MQHRMVICDTNCAPIYTLYSPISALATANHNTYSFLAERERERNKMIELVDRAMEVIELEWSLCFQVQ